MIKNINNTKMVRYSALISPLILTTLLASCGGSSNNSTDTSTETTTEEGTYTYSDCSALTEQLELMKCLSDNLLSTLTDDEISAITYELTETNATDYWSNLPLNIERNGIELTNLSDTSKTAAETLLSAALTMNGAETMNGLRSADQYLSENAFPGAVYGEDRYALSFMGTPSLTEPWIIEFTGHHYTFFASFDGGTVGLTPYFVAVEPVTFTLDNVSYDPMARHKDALVAMFESLTTAQTTSAELDETFDDLLAGPGEDNVYPTNAEGLAVSELTDEQKTLVAAVIKAYSDDAETAQTSSYTTDANLNLTYIAWSGSTDIETKGSYARIDGPNIWIEFTVQAGAAFDDNHYHSVWRDKELDYGGNFDF